MRRACRALGPASAGPAGGFGSGHGGGGPSQPSCFPITPRPIRAYTHSPACQHRSPRSFAHQPPRRRMPRRSASDTAVFTAAAARAARIPQGRPATRLPAPHSSPPPGAVLGRDRGSRTSGASRFARRGRSASASTCTWQPHPSRHSQPGNPPQCAPWLTRSRPRIRAARPRP